MFAKNLKKVRQDKHLSVEKLAQLLEVPASTIWGYEGGKRTPSIDLPIRLNRVFDVNINWLLTGSGEMYINTCENTHAMIKNETAVKNFKDWGKRLSALLAENEQTTYAFAKRTGIKESRIEKFILDSAEPTINEINLIKSNVDISIDELLYGETVYNSKEQKNFQGCMQCSDNYLQRGQKNTQEVSLSADEIIKLKQMLKKL